MLPSSSRQLAWKLPPWKAVLLVATFGLVAFLEAALFEITCFEPASLEDLLLCRGYLLGSCLRGSCLRGAPKSRTETQNLQNALIASLDLHLLGGRLLQVGQDMFDIV